VFRDEKINETCIGLIQILFEVLTKYSVTISRLLDTALITIDSYGELFQISMQLLADIWCQISQERYVNAE